MSESATTDVLSRVADVETTESGEFAIDERVGATDVTIVYTQGIVGIEIVKNQGWTEWRNFPPTPVSATIEQQYKCHAQFGYAVWMSGVWWDFETARPSNPNWLWNPQGCNFV